MTKQERVIVSAYTGFLMCNFGDMHEYIEKIMGRPVWTHELAMSLLWMKLSRNLNPTFWRSARTIPKRRLPQISLPLIDFLLGIV